MAQLAEVRPLLVTLSPSPAQFSAKPTQVDAGDGVGRQTEPVMPQVSVLAAQVTAALRPKLGVKRGTLHRHACGPSVRPYVIRSSSRGIWLFAPNGNEGARN